MIKKARPHVNADGFFNSWNVLKNIHVIKVQIDKIS